MNRRRKAAYSPGWSPANATAWCDYHDRGCNDAYIRRKHCLTKQKGRPCRHLRELPPSGEPPENPNNHHVHKAK